LKAAELIISCVKALNAYKISGDSWLNKALFKSQLIKYRIKFKEYRGAKMEYLNHQ
jgi:hypothetical protein